MTRPHDHAVRIAVTLITRLRALQRTVALAVRGGVTAAVDMLRARAVEIALALAIVGGVIGIQGEASTSHSADRTARESVLTAAAGAEAGYEATIAARVIAVTNRAACLGNAHRSVAQLQFDWTIYTADARRAKTQAAGQARISGDEASNLLRQMKAYARIRLAEFIAGELPGPLAAVVRAEQFHCPSVPAPPPPPDGFTVGPHGELHRVTAHSRS